LTNAGSSQNGRAETEGKKSEQFLSKETMNMSWIAKNRNRKSQRKSPRPTETNPPAPGETETHASKVGKEIWWGGHYQSMGGSKKTVEDGVTSNKAQPTMTLNNNRGNIEQTWQGPTTRETMPRKHSGKTSSSPCRLGKKLKIPDPKLHKERAQTHGKLKKMFP